MSSAPMERVPWSRTARTLSVVGLATAPLAQLVVPALLMALCGLGLARMGMRRSAALPHRYGPQGLRQARNTQRIALSAACLSVLLWVLYASALLP